MKLIAMDLQKGIVNEGLYNFRLFLENTAKIINAARENGIEVIYVQHDDGPGSGFTQGDEDFEIAPQFVPLAGEKRFTKHHGSCFGNPELRKYLEDAGEDTVMLVGLITDGCVDTTVKSGFDRGYHMIIPEGTNSTFDNEYMTGESSYKFGVSLESWTCPIYGTGSMIHLGHQRQRGVDNDPDSVGKSNQTTQRISNRQASEDGFGVFTPQP